MKFLKIITFFIGTCLLQIQEIYPFIIILTGPPSTGKSTLANDLKKILKYPTEIIEFDQYVIQHLKGIDSVTSSEIEAAAFEKLLERIKQCVFLNENLIIDIGFIPDISFIKLKTATMTTNFNFIPTFRILVYCSIEKILENIKQRNKSDKIENHRNWVFPFFRFFCNFFDCCQPSSKNSLDTLEKNSFLETFAQLEQFITQTSDYKNFQHLKDAVYRDFFANGSIESVGITPRQTLDKYDFFVNTGKNYTENLCKLASEINGQI